MESLLIALTIAIVAFMWLLALMALNQHNVQKRIAQLERRLLAFLPKLKK